MIMEDYTMNLDLVPMPDPPYPGVPADDVWHQKHELLHRLYAMALKDFQESQRIAAAGGITFDSLAEWIAIKKKVWTKATLFVDSPHIANAEEIAFTQGITTEEEIGPYMKALLMEGAKQGLSVENNPGLSSGNVQIPKEDEIDHHLQEHENEKL